MAYSKPKTVAKSAKKSSYVAGCPTYSGPANWQCKKCQTAM